MIHNAGLVVLADNPTLLHNVHVYATARLLHAARRAGVQAFVATSSTCVVHNGQVHLNDARVDTPHPTVGTHYMKTKIEAERIVLAANVYSGGARGRGGAVFRTCAIRLPGIYGYGDAMMVTPMLAGILNIVRLRA